MKDSFAKYRTAWIPTGLIDFSTCTFANDKSFNCPPSTLNKRLNKPKPTPKPKPWVEQWSTIQSDLYRLVEAILSEWQAEGQLTHRNRWLLHYTSVFILSMYSTDIARACYASLINFPAKERYLNEHPKEGFRHGQSTGQGVRLKGIQPFGLHFRGIQTLLGQAPAGHTRRGDGFRSKKKDVFENTFFPEFDIENLKNSGWAKAFSTKGSKYIAERFPDELFRTWKSIFESQFMCSVHITLCHQRRRYCGPKALTFFGFSVDGTRLDMTKDDRVHVSGWKMSWGEHTIEDDIAFGMSIDEALEDDLPTTLVCTSIDGQREVRYKRA